MSMALHPLLEPIVGAHIGLGPKHSKEAIIAARQTLIQIDMDKFNAAPQ